MKTPRDLSGVEVIKVLTKHYGWEVTTREGSHITLKKKDSASILTIPNHAHLKIGTLLAILRKGEIDKEDFIEKVS